MQGLWPGCILPRAEDVICVDDTAPEGFLADVVDRAGLRIYGVEDKPLRRLHSSVAP